MPAIRSQAGNSFAGGSPDRSTNLNGFTRDSSMSRNSDKAKICTFGVLIDRCSSTVACKKSLGLWKERLASPFVFILPRMKVFGNLFRYPR